jgi:hypothetical protein
LNPRKAPAFCLVPGMKTLEKSRSTDH